MIIAKSEVKRKDLKSFFPSFVVFGGLSMLKKFLAAVLILPLFSLTPKVSAGAFFIISFLFILSAVKESMFPERFRERLNKIVPGMNRRLVFAGVSGFLALTFTGLAISPKSEIQEETKPETVQEDKFKAEMKKDFELNNGAAAKAFLNLAAITQEGKYIKSLSFRPNYDLCAGEMIIKNNFYYEPKEIQLNILQSFHKGWFTVMSGYKFRDKNSPCPLDFVDENNNKIGGYSVFSGAVKLNE